MTDNIDTIKNLWLKAKQEESEAKQRRINIENQLTELMAVDTNQEGTTKLADITARIKLNRKIDADHLQHIANEAGYQSYLPKLFRWKPEVNAEEWKKAPEEVTTLLSQAITATPSKPNFTIKKGDTK